MLEPTAVQAKRDRDEVFYEYTKSICPVCKVVVDAQVNIRDGRVYLRKRCSEHGEFEALVYGDARMYVESARFNKPGTIPLEFQTEVRDGCPHDCGLCPEHKQHACLGIIEVNTGCNLDCPVCFADSGHQPDGYQITVEQCERMLDTFVASEGEAEVVMLSGGEPTIHKHILDFVDLAQARPIKSVTLNTNGIRLATDNRFVAALARRDRPGHRVHIYLQFDGLDERTHQRIRGRDLRAIKRRALDNCAEAGLAVTLVPAVERGVNEHEIGPIIAYGIEHPAVRAVSFQVVTHSGRHVEFDPLTRLTNSDVIELAAQQLPEWFRADDFFPVPCCFPTCRSITYLLVDDSGPRTTVIPIPRLVNVEDYLDYVTNRVMPDVDVREALEKLWSASAFMGTDTTNEKLAETAAAFNCAEACGVDLPEAVQQLADKAFMIVVQDFQDPYTLNVKQLMKCCVEEITPDGRIIPFCAYNSVGYREQVREQMSGVHIADVVPNATPLRPALTDSPYGSKIARDGTGARGDATNVGRSLRPTPRKRSASSAFPWGPRT
ncbi:MAG: radical SAM protein [Streptosporangiales bacterium]